MRNSSRTRSAACAKSLSWEMFDTRSGARHSVVFLFDVFATVNYSFSIQYLCRRHRLTQLLIMDAVIQELPLSRHITFGHHPKICDHLTSCLFLAIHERHRRHHLVRSRGESSSEKGVIFQDQCSTHTNTSLMTTAVLRRRDNKNTCGGGVKET